MSEVWLHQPFLRLFFRAQMSCCRMWLCIGVWWELQELQRCLQGPWCRICGVWGIERSGEDRVHEHPQTTITVLWITCRECCNTTATRHRSGDYTRYFTRCWWGCGGNDYSETKYSQWCILPSKLLLWYTPYMQDTTVFHAEGKGGHTGISFPPPTCTVKEMMS